MTNFIPKSYLKVAREDFWWDVLYHIPSILIILFYSNAKVYGLVVGFIDKESALYEFLYEYQNFFHVPLVFIAIVLPLWSKYRASLRSGHMNKETENLNVRILDSFNTAVNKKANRFRKVYETKKEGGMSDATVFKRITQPTEQIKVLCESLLVIFRQIIDSDKIKLTAITCRNNEMSNFVFHSDHKPKITVEELRKLKSTAKRCLSDRRSILISRISNSSEDFVQGKVKSNIKSIYCFPVALEREVSFVLSFSSSKAGAFTEKFHPLYDSIIGEFENRFTLEWYLDQIKSNNAK